MLRVNTGIMSSTTWMGKIDCPADWMHFSRQSADIIMYFVVSGDLYLQIDRKRYHLIANDVITILPHQLHTGYKAAKCFYYYVHFSHADFLETDIQHSEMIDILLAARKSWLSAVINAPYSDEQAIGYFPVHFHFSDVESLVEITRILDDCIYRLLHNLSYYKMEISVATNKILLSIIRCYLNDMLDSGQHRRSKCYYQVHTIIGFINENYAQHIDRYTIEKLTNLNYDHINREFKKNTTRTIMDYLKTVRIDKAKNFAMSTGYNYYEIGEMVGYENPYYFSKLFKQETGMTLSDYVKNESKKMQLY